MTLGDYLRAAAKRPWAWGQHDCCRFVADWVMSCGYGDPMDFLRPLYASEREALRTISKGGGLLALWQRGMLGVGIQEADDARMGDVGIIRRPTEDGLDEACGIFTGERWAALGLHGLVAAPADDVLAVWRV